MANTIENTLLGLKPMQRFDFTHEEYFDMVIDALGYDEVKRCVPFDLETLKTKIKRDRHLNNTPMRTWDYASGFVVYVDRWGAEQVEPCDSPLRTLLKKHKVNCYSNSEGVCILKNCARRMVMESESI